MTRFACLGGACPDTCCAEWELAVDREHYDRLRERMGDDEIDAAMRRVEERPREDRYALMVLGDDRRCRFLDADRLCTLQLRHGAELLPHACAIYPRILGRSGERLELYGSL